MRISDWSSDVCSSDLPCCRCRGGPVPGDRRTGQRPVLPRETGQLHHPLRPRRRVGYHRAPPAGLLFQEVRPGTGHRVQAGRSEEHTSELQSLMRISYAVFCLKKKKHKITQIFTTLITKATNTKYKTTVYKT